MAASPIHPSGQSLIMLLVQELDSEILSYFTEHGGREEYHFWKWVTKRQWLSIQGLRLCSCPQNPVCLSGWGRSCRVADHPKKQQGCGKLRSLPRTQRSQPSDLGNSYSGAFHHCPKWAEGLLFQSSPQADGNFTGDLSMTPRLSVSETLNSMKSWNGRNFKAILG